MAPERVREIANAVLYEGYLLYPYRSSATKRRQRWNFGVVYPRTYAEMRAASERWQMLTDCLVLAPSEAELDVSVRFLHLLTRTAVPPSEDAGRLPAPATLRWTSDSWQEGVEREVVAPAIPLSELVRRPRRVTFAFPAARLSGPGRDPAGPGVPAVLREQRPLTGAVTIEVTPVAEAEPGAFRLSVRVENMSTLEDASAVWHDDVLLRSLVSTHTLLRLQGGTFISQLDPPETLRDAAAACRHDGAWPVLVGDEGDHDSMLFSPIILYDYPQIAPESAGAQFDGTEIDDILTLRSLALSDEEKAELRCDDERTREVVERTESLSGEHLLKLHGGIRGLRTGEEGAS